MSPQQALAPAYWDLIERFRRVAPRNDTYNPEKAAQSEAKHIITEYTKCANIWRDKPPHGGTFGEAIKAAAASREAYRLLLAYAECEDDMSQPIHRRGSRLFAHGWDTVSSMDGFTKNLRQRALAAAKEAE